MRRIGLAVVLALGLVIAPLAADAQQATKVTPIGYLSGPSLSANAARLEAFRQGLREPGDVEGKNIVIEWRSADGKFDRLPALAAFHDLRHDTAITLTMAGVLQRKIMAILGHRDPRMTLRYQHLSPEHLRDVARVLDQRQASEVGAAAIDG